MLRGTRQLVAPLRTLFDQGKPNAAYHAALLFAVGMLVRVGLIQAYPVIFGGDSVTRIVYHDRIIMAHQLPALQASIHWLWSIFPVLLQFAIGPPSWVRSRGWASTIWRAGCLDERELC